MAVDFTVYRLPGGSWAAKTKERKDGLIQLTFEECEPGILGLPNGKNIGRIVGDRSDFNAIYNVLRALLRKSSERTSCHIPGRCFEFKADKNMFGGVRELTMLDGDGEELGSITGSNYDFYHMYKELKKVYGDE